MPRAKRGNKRTERRKKILKLAKGYRGTTIALSGGAVRSLYDLDLKKPCAIFVGNEGAGLSAELEAACKVKARIPMPGNVESLNAGVAGSVALFECVRQRKQ